MSADDTPPESRTSLAELAGLFARLGATSFGGPAVHVAMIREEVVVRRRWLTEARFLDLVGATALIPGPSSTELAIHIGWERRRWTGLVVAGLAFIVPAMAITGACAWAYVRFGARPGRVDADVIGRPALSLGCRLARAVGGRGIHAHRLP